MPIHDWTRVKAGIFHHFHHSWIESIMQQLNAGLLPADYYALAEQQAAGYGPDVLTLQIDDDEPLAFDQTSGFDPNETNGGLATATLAPPSASHMVQTDEEFYRRKKSSIAVRHVSDDRIVAMVEIVSPGNKAGRNAFRAFLEKTCELLEHRIHLLIIDLFPPTSRDPHGLHAAIWRELVDDPEPDVAGEKPLTLAAYESSLVVKAFVETVAVGDSLPDMPLVLEPDGSVSVPLEKTYQSAWDAVPQRWQAVVTGD